MKYLRPREEYVEQYDRMTVERCRQAERSITASLLAKHGKKKFKKEELERFTNAFNRLHLYFVQGELYAKKESVVSEWMEKDSARDRLFDTALSPENVRCFSCSSEMYVSFKHLETDLEKPDRVLFMYDCPNEHFPRRAFYHTGEEWKHTPREHVDLSDIEVNIPEKKEDPHFERDRQRFCNDEEGRKYVEWMNTAKELTAILDKQKQKEENKDLYDRVAKLKRLTIPQLKTHVTERLQNEQYTNLFFEQPALERIVTVGFSIEDPVSRSEYESRIKLTKLLKTTLEETDWRLMTEGVSYRLGTLVGRLRAYEKEEDLVQLLSKKTNAEGV